jgi:hypothetical protein
MAKTFYYDSVGLLESTINDGSVSLGGAGYNFSDGTTLTNEEYAVDQNITNAVTAWAQNDALSFDLGSAKAVDFVALYFNAAEGDDIKFDYDSAATGDPDGTAATITDAFSANAWEVVEFTEATKRYWRLIATSAGGLVGLTEISFGKKLAFDFNPDIGISESEMLGAETARSIGGVEYSLKRHDPIKTIGLTFSSISSSFKTSLQSMQDEVQNYKKFIYSEDGTTGAFHYVRLGGPIDFTEVAYQRYSCSIILVEQPS